MQREYVIPGSQHDTFTPNGAEVSMAAVEQAIVETGICLGEIRSNCTKKMICQAFQFNGEHDSDSGNVKVGRLHISDVRCGVQDCPSAIENVLTLS